MSGVWSGIVTYWRDLWRAWNQFWFAPTDPATLCLIRVLAGGMLLYTHLVWSKDLTAFFGPDGWISHELAAAKNAERLTIDPFGWLGSPALLWTVHVGFLIAFFCLFIGLWTRVTSVLAAIGAIAYATHVSPGAFFGLDKVNCMLATYLAIGPSGARYSVDRLLRIRRGEVDDPASSSSANLALRLMQIHLCVMYLFAGLGKVKGDRWWDGTATWFTIANDAYRSTDMTWLANHLYLLDFLTHATVAWELSYCFLVWNRFTRPWILAAAIGAHLFIAFCMGMQTFGWAMIFANLAFFAPALVRKACDPVAGRISLALAGSGAAAPA
ncbi:Vitamin K-dependent gamma-carboxylase [Pirellulimonas nuda]|uniref:Vitamin K-dependent gamma-carboxylase n=1 Tax=Pirellulimonas nuda TaxID=2528009 RepID=A0A518DA77_9BACT|nr:HTTM domain-containing protein [Pirellulimonas nuda]QDU88353.1 Vitamin K-dependent gamma-carboxylase [Pirellulimonas nuda]